MSAEVLLGILPLVISALFSLISYWLWLQLRSQKFLLYSAIGYLCVFIALLISLDSENLLRLSVGPIIQGFYATTAGMTAQGLSSWAGRPIRWWVIYTYILLSILTIASMMYFGRMGTTANLYAGAIIVAGMFLAGAWRAQNMLRGKPLEVAFVLVTAVLGFQYLLLPFLTLPVNVTPDIHEAHQIGVNGFQIGVNGFVGLSSLLMGITVIAVGGQRVHLEGIREKDTDPISGLMTRSAFESYLTAQLHTLRLKLKEKGQGALLFIAVHNIEAASREYGLSVREKLMTALGRSIQEQLSRDKHASEFAGSVSENVIGVYLAENSEQHIRNWVALLRTGYASEVKARGGHLERINPRVTIGAARRLGWDDFDALFRRADQSLNFARAQGPEGTYLMLSDDVLF